MWYLYIILTFLISYIFLRTYIKIKFHFWSLQPVFHIYDFMYWIRPPGIIVKSLPVFNKYTNILDITTYDINSLDESILTNVSNFINSHYLRTTDAEYIPTRENIIEYFRGSTHKSYVTLYKDPVTLYKSVITARPLYVSIKGASNFQTYYVDNLCVHPGVRKKGIAPTTIQTHYYNLRHSNDKIETCLFKREGNMTAIVPLTTYTTFGFILPGLESKVSKVKLPSASMVVIEITEQNIHLFAHFMKSNTKCFDCVINPELPTILNLIKTKNIYIYGIIHSDNIISAYVFKNPTLKYDGDNNVIECITTVTNITKCDKEIFTIGFNIALDICRKQLNATRLLIEDTSHSNYIIERLKKNTSVKIFTESPTAFFFYNYACYSIASKSCLFLY